MRAQNIVLTHFSQRYPKIPPLMQTNSTTLTEDGTAVEAKDETTKTTTSTPVIFAFDFMMLKPSNLTAASKITPALRKLYPEGEEGDQHIGHPGFPLDWLLDLAQR